MQMPHEVDIGLDIVHQPHESHEASALRLSPAISMPRMNDVLAYISFIFCPFRFTSELGDDKAACAAIRNA